MELECIPQTHFFQLVPERYKSSEFPSQHYMKYFENYSILRLILRLGQSNHQACKQTRNFVQKMWAARSDKNLNDLQIV